MTNWKMLKSYKDFEGPIRSDPEKGCENCGLKYEYKTFKIKVMVGIIIILIGIVLIFTNKVDAVEVSNLSALGAQLGGYKGTTGVLLIIVGGLIAALSKMKVKFV